MESDGIGSVKIRKSVPNQFGTMAPFSSEQCPQSCRNGVPLRVGTVSTMGRNTHVAQALASGIASQGWLLNALLESFVIHVRGLIDFFYIEEPKTDDVIAADFFTEATAWKKIRPPLSDSLSTSRKRAHKEIAHLTYARLEVTPETKGWKFVEIANEIRSVMDLFIRNVPKNLLGERWK